MDKCEYMRRRLAAVCGRYCGTCAPFLDGSCCGCAYQLGHPPGGECALFQCCVVERGLEHCGLCLDYPCQLFTSQASPLEVARLYKTLYRRAKIGTIAWLDEQEEESNKQKVMPDSPQP